MHNHADMAERLKEPRFHEVHLEWMNVMCTVVLFHSQIYGSRPKHFCVDHTQYTRRHNALAKDHKSKKYFSRYGHFQHL